MYLKLLRTHIKEGILHLHMPDGKVHTFGNQGLEVHWHIRHEKAIRRIARDWEFELGQTYMEGGWDAGDGDLRELLGVLRRNFSIKGPARWYISLLKLLQKFNNIARSYRYISHHYDTDEAIFRMFLDREMFYSCAFFNSPEDSLEQAQQNKADIIARKLLL